MPNETPPYRAIWDLLKTGQVVPVLGPQASLIGRESGLSWSAVQPLYPPTSDELASHLAGMMVTYPEAQLSHLTMVAQYVRVMMGRPLLVQWLRGVFDHDFHYSSIHEFIATVPSNLLILSTNFDDMLERAFTDKGYPFDRVVYPSDNEEWREVVLHYRHGSDQPEPQIPNKLLIDLNRTTVIYKLQGAVNRIDPALDSYLIDEDDVCDFVGRTAAKKVIPAIFIAHLRRRYFLYLGYNLSDWNTRMMLSQIEKEVFYAPASRLPSWAIQSNVSALERDLWEKRNVTVYDMDLEQFIHELRREQQERP